jgi:hypothetical protein
MAKAGSKIEVGTVYRVDGAVEVKAPPWFRRRLLVGDLVLCVAKSGQGAHLLLLDVLDGAAGSVVGIDEAGEPTLTIVITPAALTPVWTPTRRDMLSLQRGDVLRGDALTSLTAAQVHGRATNGTRAGYVPVPVEG